jgi:ABC-type glycerol-3-phosphate transport system permease component
MRNKKGKEIGTHIILIVIAFMTLLPFFFVINNSLRTSSELYHSFFGFPTSIRDIIRFTWYHLNGKDDQIILKIPPVNEAGEEIIDAELVEKQLTYGDAVSRLSNQLTKGYRYSWKYLRGYMLNTFLVCIITVLGVVFIASMSAYIFARYRFPGHKVLFLIILSIMMIPGVLTLVPGFLLVKQLGLLNSYWVLILPYIAGGQILAIFLFKTFFDGLPEDLFESARIDGAGHFRLYWHIVLPLSRPIIAVVAILNILGAWNNFLWPFITNTDDTYHVVASGLFLLSQSPAAMNPSTMYAAYFISSIPLLVLFLFATRPFMRGITAGAFKA